LFSATSCSTRSHAQATSNHWLASLRARPAPSRCIFVMLYTPSPFAFLSRSAQIQLRYLRV
jgi:hypothetical protein